MAVVIAILVAAGFFGYAFGTTFSIGSFVSMYNQGRASVPSSGPTGVTFTSANALPVSLTSLFIIAPSLDSESLPANQM